MHTIACFAVVSDSGDITVAEVFLEQNLGIITFTGTAVVPLGYRSRTKHVPCWFSSGLFMKQFDFVSFASFRNWHENVVCIICGQVDAAQYAKLALHQTCIDTFTAAWTAW